MFLSYIDCLKRSLKHTLTHHHLSPPPIFTTHTTYTTYLQAAPVPRPGPIDICLVIVLVVVGLDGRFRQPGLSVAEALDEMGVAHEKSLSPKDLRERK